MKQLKILSLIMAIMMIATVVFSCKGNESDNGNNTTTTKVTTTPKVTTTEETEPKDPPKDVGEISWTVETPYTDALDLTAVGDIYWEHYGDNEDHKANADDIFTEYFEGAQNHDDNKAPLTWTDGTNLPVMENSDPEDPKDPSRHGKNGTSISITIPTAGIKTLTLFVGAWNGTNTLTINTDDNSEFEKTEDILECGNDAAIAVVKVDLSKFTGSTITVWVERTTGTGNVSLSGIAASAN